MASVKGWPVCRTGDVLLVFSAAKQMQLHSEILAAHCEFFRNAFQDHPGVDISSSARKAGVTVKWRFDFDASSHNSSLFWEKEAQGKSNYSDIGEFCFTVSFDWECYYCSILFEEFAEY
jgi:hypothetical protein